MSCKRCHNAICLFCSQTEHFVERKIAVNIQPEIFEVGPRDGFQNQKTYIPKETKLQIIDAIVKTGVRNIQVTSFVSPKAIPQMIDSEEVARYCVETYGDINLYALAPNLRGATNAYNCGIRSIFYVVSLSESHNKANINRTHEQSMDEYLRIREHLPDMHICMDLATTFGCPFEGKPETQKVIDFLGPYMERGLDEVDLCDTIGIANPAQVREVIAAVKAAFPGLGLQVHIHDTRNMGMVNTLAAIEAGVMKCQSTLGGLGGCPFAPGASGNLATEDLVYMLNDMGYDTGIDSAKLIAAAKLEQQLLGEGNFSGHNMNIGASVCTGL